MKNNQYFQYSLPMLQVIKKSLEEDLKDSNFTNKQRSNICKELEKVKEAIKTK